MVTMPDRRREPRGGHHTGSLLELSGRTPLDLVLYGGRKAVAGIAGENGRRHLLRLPVRLPIRKPARSQVDGAGSGRPRNVVNQYHWPSAGYASL